MLILPGSYFLTIVLGDTYILHHDIVCESVGSNQNIIILISIVHNNSVILLLSFASHFWNSRERLAKLSTDLNLRQQLVNCEDMMAQLEQLSLSALIFCVYSVI